MPYTPANITNPQAEITAPGTTEASDTPEQAPPAPAEMPVPTEADELHNEKAAYAQDIGRFGLLDPEQGDFILITGDEAEHVKSQLHVLRDTQTHEDASDLTDEEKTMLGLIKPGVTHYGEDLGINLQSRFPREQDMHAYDGAIAVEKAEGGGFHAIESGIHVSRELDPLKERAVWTHEIAHELAGIAITEGVNNETGEPTFHLDDNYTTLLGAKVHAFREWVADTASTRMQQAAGVEDPKTFYNEFHTIGKALVAKTAEQTGQTTREVENLLVKGYLSSRFTKQAVTTAAAGVGHEAFMRFATVDRRLNLQEARDLAVAMGLPDAVADFERQIANSTN
jgi:hypothetical protein